MKKTPLRSEIPSKDKWAVHDLYARDELWDMDYRRLQGMAKEPCIYQGRLSESAQILYLALKESEDTDWLAEKVYVYAFMRYYEDTTNAVYQEMSGKAQMISVKLSEKYAFLEAEILSMDSEVLQLYLKDEKLQKYGHLIDDMLYTRKHTLSEKEEMLLAASGQIAAVPNEIFSKFNNADVKFGTIRDADGNEVQLTNGNFVLYMQSQDRRVRKDAFYGLYRQYRKYINMLAACFYGNVKQAVFYAGARKYESTMHKSLAASFIPVEVYTNLIEAVHGSLSLMHRYVSIRKKALKVDELHFYDIYAPMVEDFEWKISYEEAKEITLKALAPLGHEYLDKIREGFDSGWIDVYENAGKRTGAFSWGAYGTHPYVLMNYTDTLNDVFTLVHELGHAMHTYYSNKTQPYIYAGYKIFVAEVASTCNECLLMQYLLDHCRDKKQQKYLLNYYFEQFKGTLFRQTMFAEFEMETHKLAGQGEVLTADKLCSIYKALNSKYFGEDMVIDEEIAYEWARIPHFYTPFYVYQYATGYSAAVAISARIIRGDEKTIQGYKKFLSGGSSLHPIELLQLCGIDMEKPDVVRDALNVFRQLLDRWDADD